MIERITELYVILENKPSILGDLCSFLAENEINIDAIGVFHDTAKLYVQSRRIKPPLFVAEFPL